MVQMADQGHISDQVSVVHEVREELCLVGGGGQLLLNMLKLVLLHGL